MKDGKERKVGVCFLFSIDDFPQNNTNNKIK